MKPADHVPVDSAGYDKISFIIHRASIDDIPARLAYRCGQCDIAFIFSLRVPRPYTDNIIMIYQNYD